MPNVDSLRRAMLNIQHLNLDMNYITENDQGHLRDVENSIESNNLKLLYTTIHAFIDTVRHFLPTWSSKGHQVLNRVVVDEAHLIQSVRLYEEIGAMRQSMPTVPLLVITHAITGSLQQIMASKYQLSRDFTLIYEDVLVRPNIDLQVVAKSVNMVDFLLQFTSRRGIVYTSENRVDHLVNRINMKTKVQTACKFGEGSEDKQYNNWKSGTIPMAIATIQFHFSIHHDTCDYIVHEVMPSSFVNYLHDINLVGRHVAKANAYMFLDYKSVFSHSIQMTQEVDLYKKLFLYADNRVCCRRQMISKMAGLPFEDHCQSPSCDNCKMLSTRSPIQSNITEEAKSMLSFIHHFQKFPDVIKRFQQEYTLLKASDICRLLNLLWVYGYIKRSPNPMLTLLGNQFLNHPESSFTIDDIIPFPSSSSSNHKKRPRQLISGGDHLANEEPLLKNSFLQFLR
eukprot:CAMPEP_0117422750 /NCGR_PEP_ID=MMETSP0758-20121206/3535_1 /TAXON_ID=63605 /ORGANISM="Percolomonas cosmopolitus, Strain AE-1 (ATCC 50343)" /LENGTH=452 /DNA_ID=CAMNT_0005205573 /DNA_START=310 /DNA_END=1664 /DNA_ORIENTATION=-